MHFYCGITASELKYIQQQAATTKKNANFALASKNGN